MSGGQSGVDRAALDVAIKEEIRWGGFCPRGGRADDYPDPPGLLRDYPNLVETPQTASRQRTIWNVTRSDATLVLFFLDADSPGTALTVKTARDLGRRFIEIDLNDSGSADQLLDFFSTLAPLSTLNIAGPSESQAPGIYQASRLLLARWLPFAACAKKR